MFGNKYIYQQKLKLIQICMHFIQILSEEAFQGLFFILSWSFFSSAHKIYSSGDCCLPRLECNSKLVAEAFHNASIVAWRVVMSKMETLFADFVLLYFSNFHRETLKLINNCWIRNQTLIYKILFKYVY